MALYSASGALIWSHLQRHAAGGDNPGGQFPTIEDAEGHLRVFYTSSGEDPSMLGTRGGKIAFTRDQEIR